jgi:hypothetical protein
MKIVNDLLDGEVARTFLKALGFLLFLLQRFVLGKYLCYKTCSSGIAPPNKNKFDWFRNQQYNLTECDIFPKTFASYII